MNDFAELVYRLLLPLYPASFRREYDGDLVQAFRDRRREARYASPFRGRLAFWGFILKDLAVSVPTEIRRERACKPTLPAPRRSIASRKEDIMSILVQDLKFATRSLAKRPAFTLVAIATLALGIAANSAIFSVVNGVLLLPMPYEDPNRLVFVRGLSASGIPISVSFPNYYDWREGNRTLGDFGGYRWSTAIVTGEATPEVVTTQQVLGDFFSVLGVAPQLGRSLTHEDNEPGAEPLAVISHGFWQSRFGGNPDVLGKPLTLDERLFTVVGVMPPRFWASPRVSVYVPLGFFAGEFAWENRGPSYGLAGIARRKPGASLDDVRADIDRVVAGLREAEGEQVAGARTSSFADTFLGPARAPILLLGGAVGFVLLIACANVANLLLARGEGRRREIALRTALGAARTRLIRQLLTESVVLALAGGLAGLALTWAGLRFLLTLLPSNTPFIERVGLDPNVLAFTFAISILTGLLFGFLPAFRASRPDLAGVLKDGGQGASSSRHHLRSALVVTEVALSLVLLVGAGLLVRSLDRLHHVDKGFDEEGVVTMRVSLPNTRYGDRESWTAFYGELVERVGVLPGVSSAAVTSILPLAGPNREVGAIQQGVPVVRENVHSTLLSTVSAEHFETLSISLVEGRAFTDQDREGAPEVVIVDETMAKKFWPGESAIGRQVAIEFRSAHGGGMEPIYRTVVGVAKHVRHYQLDELSRVEAYVPYTQPNVDDLDRLPGMALTVRSAAAIDPLELLPQIRNEVQAIDPDIPVSRIRTMEEVVAQELAVNRSLSESLAMFGAVALMLAALGIYGVMSYMVAERRQEIGVRIALGARTREILLMVSRQALGLAGAGIVIGLVAAAGLSRLLGSFLFEVDPFEPAIFAGISLLLAAVAFTAAYVPAYRAGRVDPVQVLREE